MTMVTRERRRGLSSLSPFTGRGWSEQSEDRVRGLIRIARPLTRLASFGCSPPSPRFAGRGKEKS
jgi:hypothetical protein